MISRHIKRVYSAAINAEVADPSISERAPSIAYVNADDDDMASPPKFPGRSARFKLLWYGSATLCYGRNGLVWRSALPIPSEPPVPNAYPEKPLVAFDPMTVPMTNVIGDLKAMDIPVEVKRSTYVIFRNESGNGKSGFNNNFVGAQADGGRWPDQFNDEIVGTVVHPENKTGKLRRFVAFGNSSDSLDFLANRVQDRGIFIGGTTSHIVNMTIESKTDLARAYHKEWVSGSPISEPSSLEEEGFISMYDQAVGFFADPPAMMGV